MITLGRDEEKRRVWNRRMLDFALRVGFEARLCQPHRAQTRSKVESGVQYVRRNMWPSLRVDPTGYFYGDDLLGATEAGRWIEYVIINPETGENQRKHTFAALHDGHIFASGWYEQ